MCSSDLARMRAMGVSPASDGSHPFVGIRYIDGETVAEGRFRDGEGLGVRRLALSLAMIGRARQVGVTFAGGAGAWSQDGDGVTVTTPEGPIRGRWLVAADGAASRIRREAGISSKPRGRRFGMRRHFAVAPWSPFVEVWWADGVEAYVTPCGPRRVGVAFLWSGEKGDYEAFLARFPALRERLADPETLVRGAGPLGVEVSHRVAGRVLLAGDAAGYVDALTGEGISLAWECGAALVAATEAGNPARYEADWRRLTRRHRWLTAGLLEVAARPWLRRGVVRALALSPSGFSTMLGVNTGAIGGIRSLPE